MIDYGVLHTSTVYYAGLGYDRIEAPWTVTRATSDITKPDGAKDWEIVGKDKVLVASGEQSFLYLYLKGFLPKGEFQTITPCFREEPFDFTHTKYFMKNELINTSKVSKSQLESMVGHAYDFFAEYLGPDHLEVITIDDKNIDIYWLNFEIGSYSIRSCQWLDWICGTGVAEPRFSSMIELKKKLGA
jgi:hypothetical protein